MVLTDYAVTAGAACCTMTTGSTMQIIAEALGMWLPHNSACLGITSHVRGIARNAGRTVMKLWEPDIRPRDIITEKSISNAIKVCLAIGGSINSLYHFPAIAIEAWLREDVWGLFDKFSSEIPTLVKIIPNGEHDLEEYDRAGVLLY